MLASSSFNKDHGQSSRPTREFPDFKSVTISYTITLYFITVKLTFVILTSLAAACQNSAALSLSSLLSFNQVLMREKPDHISAQIIYICTGSELRASQKQHVICVHLRLTGGTSVLS